MIAQSSDQIVLNLCNAEDASWCNTAVRTRQGQGLPKGALKVVHWKLVHKNHCKKLAEAVMTAGLYRLDIR